MPDAAISDHVLLVHADGQVRGRAPRASVHTTDTPLHLGFSCYVLHEDGSVLVTRRALTKRTWPGVWTNSFCGHPRQGEALSEAVTRHARHELGMEVQALRPALPDFRYRAVDASGVVENEICPVFVAEAASAPVPRPSEVMELRWVRPEHLIHLAELAPWTLSPWAVRQIPALRAHLAPAAPPADAGALRSAALGSTP
ncbi:isopentenyl-diphosphate Delta-isomerase [Brachybacterium sp. YJGR34]|uniref:isopentenyl-diphosphate Delta-isomerase n=1 Tax=Brachybacterium sp. YJGR34 TaxID=2059911 RepID=UPI000E0A58F5|nr:isopentenyl-diphosphate Delta-isomerase [Brachybacterium sp. YJGR34]